MLFNKNYSSKRWTASTSYLKFFFVHLSEYAPDFLFSLSLILYPFLPLPPFPLPKWLMMNDWCLIYVFRTLFTSGAALKIRTENCNKTLLWAAVTQKVKCVKVPTDLKACHPPSYPFSGKSATPIPAKRPPPVRLCRVFCAASLVWQLFGFRFASMVQWLPGPTSCNQGRTSTSMGRPTQVHSFRHFKL